jgi:uncharacterized protein
MSDARAIEPFFFGPADRRLYGCYDAPRGAVRSCGALLCYPMGPEYFSSHRGLRQLAARLSQKGFPAMRFDYFGTGDSAGNTEEASPAEMEKDLRAALGELQRRSRCTSLAMVGQRLGASSILSSTFPGEPISRIVLWDPILRGADLVAEILDPVSSSVGRSGSASGDESAFEHKGFVFSAKFRDELMKMDVSQPESAPAPRVLIVETTPGGGGEKLAVSYRGLGARVEYVFSETARPESDTVDRITVPARIIQGIVSWMENAAA